MASITLLGPILTSSQGAAAAAGDDISLVGGAGGTSSGAGAAVKLTGGAGTAGNADGGCIVVTTGAKQGTGSDGFIRMVGVISRKQASPGTMTTAATISVANMVIGIIVATPSAGATAAYTLPTGTVMDAAGAVPAALAANDSFDLTIINVAAALADTITLTAASGFTIVGDPIVQSAHASSTRLASGTFRCRKTAANTFVAYRMA